MPKYNINATGVTRIKQSGNGLESTTVGWGSIVGGPKSSPTELDNAVEHMYNDSFNDASFEGLITGLKDRINLLEEQMVGIKQTDVAVVSSADAAELVQADKDLIVSVAEPVNDTKSIITGKSVEIKAFAINNAVVQVNATEDVNIKGLVATGVHDRTAAATKTNAQLNIPKGKHIRISDCVMGQTGYNVIEIGLSEPVKSVVIDNVDFTAENVNNDINIYATEDGAVVTISNCSFATCSNPIRLSNRGGGKLIVNLVNCNFKWERGNAPYTGIILFQDYTSGSVEAEEANNLFGRDKVQINMIGCVADHEEIKVIDIEDVCGTGDDNQLFYVYRNKANAVIPFGDGSAYPVIRVDHFVYNTGK